jgi:hypothetical protein
VPFVPPLLHAFFPDSKTIAQYFYPPLGDAQRIAQAGTVGFLFLTTFVVFACCQSARKIRPVVPVILMVGSILCMCALIALYALYVRNIPIHSVNLEVPVSIGYQKTEFALRTYPNSDDWEMLHDRGPYEEQIQMLWTRRSIIVVRVFLWLLHTLALTCFLSVACLAVYQHAAEEALSEPEKPA